MITRRARWLGLSLLFCTGCPRPGADAGCLPDGRVLSLLDGSPASDAVAIDTATTTDVPALPDGPDPGACRPWTVWNEGLTGGVVNDVAFDTRHPGVVYAVSGRLVFRSDDSGRSFALWGQAPSGINQLAFPAMRPDVVVAASGGGMLESTDQGRNFRVAALNGISLTTLVTHPAVPQELMAGTSGGGIYRSLDNGAGWWAATGGVPWSEISSLAGDPSDQTGIIAGVTLLNDSAGESNDGALLRNDSLYRWSVAMPAVGMGRAIRFCPARPNEVYAAVRRGVARSTDHGRTWSMAMLGGQDVIDINVSNDCNVMYATEYQVGLHRSENGGSTWTAPLTAGLSLQPGTQFPDRLAIDPADAKHILAATHGGLFTSTDGGDTWSRVNGIDAVGVRGLSAAADGSGSVWMVTQGSGVWQRATAGNWTRVSSAQIPNDWGYSIGVDPHDSSRVFAGMWYEGYLSTDSGDVFGMRSPGANPFGVAFHPSNPLVLFIATQINGVMVTTDGGATWNPANTGLDAWDTGAGHFIDVRAVVFDESNPRNLFIGTNGRGVYLSTDGGASWVPGAAQLSTAAVMKIVIRSNGAGSAPTLFALTTDRGVWRSDDGGATFRDVSAGLPSLFVGDLVRHAATGDLYVSTSQGIFHSTDGTSWTAFETSCVPRTDLGSMAIIGAGTSARLIVGTSNGGVLSHPL